MGYTKEQAAEYARGWRQRNKEHLKYSKGNYTYERRYGLTKQSVDAAKERTEGFCSICKVKTDPKLLYIDHCHNTGKVRGFVCNYCNMCLGWYERIGLEKINEHLSNNLEDLTIDMDKWKMVTSRQKKNRSKKSTLSLSQFLGETK